MSVGKPKTAEMHPGPGFRIRHAIERSNPDIVKALSQFETPAISDLMNRLYTMSAEIRCLTDTSHRVAGPACTVKVYPGDNLMVHKSLDVAQPGDVIVVDTGLSGETAALGDLVSTKAHHRGIAGFVVDGMIRDLPGILQLGDFPVFARGVTPLGPMHRGPGEINYPVSVGGIVVFPGDVVVGDQNGIVVVRRELAAELLARLLSQSEAEADYLAAVRRGEFSNAWVDTIIAESGALVDQPDKA